MRNRKLIVAALAICTGFAMNVASASAASAASDATCRDMARQVKTALTGNQQSSSYQDAVKQQGYGRDFCDHSMYQVGVDHYAAALKLLGAG